MVMTLLAPADGKVHFQLLEGSLMTAGDLIARLELDNPAAVQQVTPYTGGFPEMGPPLVHNAKVDQRFKDAVTAAKMILQGVALLFIAAPFLCKQRMVICSCFVPC